MSNILVQAKRTMAVALTVSMVAWTLSVALLGFALPAMGTTAGTAIKACASPKVYSVLADGQTIAQYTDEGVYYMWRKSDWSDIGSCLTDLSGYTDNGDTVEFKLGSLVKVNDGSSPDVSLVVADSTIRKIADWDTYVQFGWSAGNIYHVSPSELAKYTKGSEITTSTPTAEVREGAVVKYAGSPDVYYIKGGLKNLITNETAFFANFPSFKPVITLPDTETHTAGDDITAGDSTINRPVGKSSGGGTPPVVTGSKLQVILAPDSRATTVVTDGEGEIYTSILATAGTDGAVRITSLKVQRLGDAGERGDFNSLHLIVNGKRRSNARSINTDDEANLDVTVGDNYIDIPAGSTVRLDIAANIVGVGNSNNDAATASDATDSGHTNTLAVTDITTASGVTVTGLPVVGNPQIISGVNAQPLDVDYRGSDSTIKIGDEQVEIGEFKFINDSTTKDMELHSFTVKNVPETGTAAGGNDVSNIKLYNGSEVISTGVFDTDRYIQFIFDPIAIAKGGSKYVTLKVKADIVGGPDEVVQLVVDRDEDVFAYLTSSTARPAVELLDADLAAAAYTIQGGSLTVSKASTSPVAQTILDNIDNVVLLRTNLIAAQGEVQIDSMDVNLASENSNDIADADVKTLRIYLTDEDGTNRQNLTDTSSVAVATTAEGFTNANAANTFTDSFTITGTKILVVEIDLASGSGGTIKAQVLASDMTVKRTTDDAAVSPSGTATGELFTVIIAAAGTTAISGSPVSATKVQGESNVDFLGFTIKSNNESSTISVKSIKLTLDGRTAAALDATPVNSDVSNVRLYSFDGTTLYAKNPSVSALDYTFTNYESGFPTAIDENGVKILVKADISASVTSTIADLRFEISADGNVEADDINNDDVTMTGTVNTANTVVITIASRGKLDFELRNDEVLGKQILAGTGSGTGLDAVEAGRFRFISNNETVKVKKLIFTEANGNDPDVARVHLYDRDKAKVVASTSAITTAGVVTFDGLSENVLPGTSNKRTYSLLIDTNSTGTGGGATSADPIRFTINAGVTDIEARGSINAVYAAPLTDSGTQGVVIAAPAATAASATDITAITAATTTELTVSTKTSTFDAGNLVLVQVHGGGVACGGTLAATAEYMLIESVDSTGLILTVRRGVAGSTAQAGHLATADTTECDVEWDMNTHRLYASKISIGAASSTPSGTLSAWSSFTTVYKFKITPDAASEEDAVLNSLSIGLRSADGIGPTAASEWFIDEARLKNGASTVIKTIGASTSDAIDITTAGSSISATVAGTLVIADTSVFTVNEWVTIREDGESTDVAIAQITAIPSATALTISAATITGTALPDLVGDNDTVSADITYGSQNLVFGDGDTAASRLNETITDSGETFTLEIKVGGLVSNGDALQFTIDDFGSMSVSGTVTEGGVQWDDSKADNIKWIVDDNGQAPDNVDGGLFDKRTS